jgi:hypothetical protein
MIKNSSKIIALGSIITLFAFGLALHNNILKLPIERLSDPQDIVDFSNDKLLMGASHNVFVGKVKTQVSTKDRGAGPETQFAVDVVHNIKGSLTGTVKINQFGGYQNGILYLMDSDIFEPSDSSQGHGDKLLEPGKTYLFSTRYNPEENWYTLVSHSNSRKLMSSDKNLKISQLKSLSEKDPRVIQLQEAYKNEILFDIDVKTNNTRNSYASTHPVNTNTTKTK